MSLRRILKHSPVNLRRIISIQFCLLLVLSPASLFAQNEGEESQEGDEKEIVAEDQEEIQEIVVSASRVPVPREHVGSAISVFTSEEIERRNPTFVHELLREVPGVAVSQTGAGGGTAQVRIRGAEGNHTLMLIDGIGMNDPFSSDEFYFEHLPVGYVDSLEVLRGPQSSIYGSESIGGVVSITTPIPEQGFESSAEVELGSYNTRRLKAYLGGASENAYGSVIFSFADTDGVSAKTDNEEPDGFKNSAIHFKSGFRLTDQVDLSTVLMQIESDKEYDSCFDASFSSSNDCLSEVRKTAFGSTLTFTQHEGVVHKLSVSKARHKAKEFREGSDNGRGVGETQKISLQGTVFFTRTPDSEQSTILAIERETAKVDPESQFHSANIEPLHLRSYVLEHRANFSDQLILSASARYDDNRKNNFQSESTYRGTIAWIPNDQMRVHSSFGTGVKFPAISEIYGYGATWDSNLELSPESSKNWDLGLETGLGSTDLTLDITYYHNEIDSLISSSCYRNCDDGDFQNDVFRSINLPGVSTTKGWELSLDGTLNEYDVSAHVAFTRGFDAQGNELVRRPSQIASFNIFRAFELNGKAAEFNLNVQHTGRQTDIVWPSYVDLASYTLVNLNGSFQLTQKLQLTGRFTNLFDKDYEQVKGFGVEGRAVFFGLRGQF